MSTRACHCWAWGCDRLGFNPITTQAALSMSSSLRREIRIRCACEEKCTTAIHGRGDESTNPITLTRRQQPMVGVEDMAVLALKLGCICNYKQRYRRGFLDRRV